MNNSDVVEKISIFQKEIQENLLTESSKWITPEEISVDDGFFLGDIPMNEVSSNKLLNMFGLKKNFPEISKKMHPDDWKNVNEKIKKVFSNKNIYARIKEDSSSKHKEVKNIFIWENKKDDFQDSPSTRVARYDEFFKMIKDQLEMSEMNVALEKRNMHYVESTGEVVLQFLTDRQIDMFGSGIDPWQKGTEISFSSMNFSSLPFFNRLICTNGVSTSSHGKQFDIQSNRFNRSKIILTIQNALGKDNLDIEGDLHEAVYKLKNSNLSYEEFEGFKKMFMKEDETLFEKVQINSMFDDSYLIQAYGEELEKMPSAWKKTADTGKNAYRFFNDLTWISSHREDSGLDLDFSRALQISAGNLLFKKKLDLASLAPRVVIPEQKYISE
jgi:hypothetical protein